MIWMWNRRIEIRKLIQRRKNGFHPSKNGHMSLHLHLRQIMGSLKHVLGKNPNFFTMNSNWRIVSKIRKVTVNHQTMGIWPWKHVRNTEKRNSLQYCNKKDLQMGVWDSKHLSLIEFGQKSILEGVSQQKGVLVMRLGSNTHFLMGYTHFIPIKRFLNWFILIPEKKVDLLGEKSGFEPKTCL